MMTLFPSNDNSPKYTVRMLLTGVTPEEKQEDEITMKKFSHFTLGCTLNDESEHVLHAINNIAHELNEEITFDVNGIINLNTEDRPLWGVKIDLGASESQLRKIFSSLDKTMCNERNGNLYVWDVDNYPTACLPRCPHVTIGPNESDKEKALQLVNLKCSLTFGAIDYKKTGPHDPNISVFLNEDKRLENSERSSSMRITG